MALEFIGHPHAPQRIGDILVSNLSNAKWQKFDAAVAFVKASGVKHIAESLSAFCRQGHARILIGVSFGGTSVEGLSTLRDSMGGHGEIWICHNAAGFTFHPKVFVFRNEAEAVVIVGSTNLTEGGLFTNSEAAIVKKIDRTNLSDASFLQGVDDALNRWCDTAAGTTRLLDDALLDQLARRGYLPPEVYSSEAEETTQVPSEEADEPELFAAAPVPPAPRKTRIAIETAHAHDGTIFMMTLQRTDVGVGQVTAGTSKRSPEIFIPLVARDARPKFWEWPDGFTEDATHPGKFDRTGVRMLVGTQVEMVNMMTWPAKSDFRLRSEALRSAGRIGDILKIERVQGETDYDYRVVIIPMASRDYAAARALCVNKVRNSEKEYCYR